MNRNNLIQKKPIGTTGNIIGLIATPIIIIFGIYIAWELSPAPGLGVVLYIPFMFVFLYSLAWVFAWATRRFDKWKSVIFWLSYNLFCFHAILASWPQDLAMKKNVVALFYSSIL